MSYAITIRRSAIKQLADVPGPHDQRIKAAIRALADQPRPRGCAKLQGRDGWRIRIGRYRVIYDIFDAERRVDVVDIDHRRDVYR